MSIVIAPINATVATPSAPAAGVVLQTGQVITAQVVQILGNDQVQIAIGNQTIEATTQVPLQPGQTLQLQVSQTPGGIGLAIVNSASTAASQAAAGGSAPTDTVSLAPELVASLAAAPPAATNQNNPLTPLETLVVSLAAGGAATQQTSLAPLFANLGVAATLPALPAQVQQAVTQVLAQRTSLDPGLSGSDIKQAFQNSGLFLEASLASGSASTQSATSDLKAALIVLRQVLTSSFAQASAAGTTSAVPTAQADLAAPQGAASAEALPGITTAAVAQGQGTTTAGGLLAQLGQTLLETSAQPVTIVAGAEAPVTASPPIVSAASAPNTPVQGATAVIAQEILDLGATGQILSPTSTPADAAARAAASSAALNLLQEALQASPLASANPSRFVFENSQALALIPAITGSRTPAIDDAEFARTNLPPPPINGALPAAQPVAPATLAPHLPVETVLQHLLADTDGAIARQTLLQVASLPGQTDTAAGRIDPLAPRWNFEIPFATPQGTAMAQFEISRDGGGNSVEPAKRVWRARFSLDVEPAGPVHALISLSGERTSVRMWAERPATALQLRAGVSELSQALSRAELQPGDIVVRDGAPSQSASAAAGHFLDRAL